MLTDIVASYTVHIDSILFWSWLVTKMLNLCLLWVSSFMQVITDPGKMDIGHGLCSLVFILQLGILWEMSCHNAGSSDARRTRL